MECLLVQRECEIFGMDQVDENITSSMRFLMESSKYTGSLKRTCRNKHGYGTQLECEPENIEKWTRDEPTGSKLRIHDWQEELTCSSPSRPAGRWFCSFARNSSSPKFNQFTWKSHFQVLAALTIWRGNSGERRDGVLGRQLWFALSRA